MSYVLRRTAVRFSPAALRTKTCRSSHLPILSRTTCDFQKQTFSRAFSISRAFREDESDKRAKELSERAMQREERLVTSGTSAQTRENDRPWQRDTEGNRHPKSTMRDPAPEDKSKGRLLTTPTRLLKLILPMPFHPKQEFTNETVDDTSDGHNSVEPLAILVHPQQPLSYLERLIQAEIPPIKYKGRDKLPDIAFRAETDSEDAHKQAEKKKSATQNVASYSGLGHEGPDKEQHDKNWVRWSGSTEVGDFIRDAARGREFAIDIEGHPEEVRVAVPSFSDRTYYIRMRLRRMSRQITQMSSVKNECDMLAHKGAHRLAQGGFAALASWWGIVYYVTFHTEMGWDLVEPVTYLAGLTTIMGGYLWFLYISRDLSYKAAMNVTVSRRQNALYQEKGFDINKWEQLVHDANVLRKEVKIIATEYDVEWDEMKDLGGHDVKEVLEEEKKDDKDDKKKDRKDEKSSDKKK